MNSDVPTKKKPIWVIPILAILAGTAAGATSAIIRYQQPEMQLAGHVAGKVKEPVVPLETRKARAILPHGNEYDFGSMARGDSKSHSFQIRNIGGGPLTLKVLSTTCKCTVGELETDTIQSGQTEKVTLTWDAKSYDREFRQSATIETNDRANREIVFSVYGKVTQLALPEVPVVQFNRISRSEPQSFSTAIYGYRDDDLVITSHDILDEKTAEWFDVKVEPLAKEKWEDPEATSGLLCTIDVKPGLPLGEVQQGLRLHTNKKDIPPLAISVEMVVVSDISGVGPGYRSDRNLLIWKEPAKSDVDNVRPLFLIVKGQYKADVEFSLLEADPEGILTAEFGEPVDIKRMVDGKSTVVARKTPVNVIIKKGAAGVQRLGNVQGPLGKLRVKTTHPEIDELVIGVKFSVE